MRRLAAAALALMTSACGVLNQENTAATLEAQNVAYATELVQLDEAATQESAEAGALTEAMVTEIAVMNGVNAQLFGTLMAVVTPTPALESAPFDPLTPGAPGQTMYVSTGASTAINQADGCVVDPRARFGPGEERIYATFVGYNFTAGTLFRAQWYYEGELVQSDSWSSPRDYEELCIWFYITPQDVAFTPGSWQVRIFVNEVNTATPIEFIIEGDMMDG